MQEQPLVSVVTITRNRGKLIGRCIKSILNQTYRNLEYILIDGASTDSTDEVVASFKDERLIYIKLEVNLDIKTTLDIGIARAKGKYITFLDSDDEYVPEKIFKQVSFFEGLKEDCGFVYCWMTYFDEQTKEILKIHNPTLRGFVPDKVVSEPVVSGTPTLMFKIEVLRDLDGWKSADEIGIVSDWELCARACQKYKVDYIPESLVNVYINHGSQRQSEHSYYNQANLKYIKFTKYFLDTFQENFKRDRRLAYPHYRTLFTFHFRAKSYNKALKYLFKAFILNPLGLVKFIVSKTYVNN